MLVIFNKFEKFFSHKKKLFVSVLLISNLLITFFGIAVFSVDKLIQKNEIKNYMVVLDPGHGGDDGGAVSPNGVLEKDLNLEISLKLKSILQVAGFNVIMTRETDTALHDGRRKGKKRTDLNERLKIIREAQKNAGDNVIFISIHQNIFPVPKYSGSQIFFSPNNPKSELLAKCIRKPIVEFLQNKNHRDIKVGGKSIYLLKNSEIPSCLIECGFLSNPDEERNLQDENYQKKLAFCIFCGISDYFVNG